MSSKQHLDALAAERAHSATLRKIILLVAAVGGLGMYFAHALPKRLDLHVAPDMKAGDTVQIYPSGETAVVAEVRYAGLVVDGGASIVAGELQPFEAPPAPSGAEDAVPSPSPAKP